MRGIQTCLIRQSLTLKLRMHNLQPLLNKRKISLEKIRTKFKIMKATIKMTKELPNRNIERERKLIGKLARMMIFLLSLLKKALSSIIKIKENN